MDFTRSNRPKDSKGISKKVLLNPLSKKAPVRYGFINSLGIGIALTLIICKV